MFFKNKKDKDFELKTEEVNIKDDYYDNDYFRYEDDDSMIIEPYKASKVQESNNIEDTMIKTTTKNMYSYEEPIKTEEIYSYEEPVTTENNNYEEKVSESNNYEETTIINNNYFYEDDITENKEESKKKFNFHLSSKMLYISNKVASIILIITIVIATMILFDVIMLTRFEKGPFFAIKTKTYNDGGTKVYHGIGYKVIKYNIDGGRHDMVVGNYSITYSK